MATETGIEDLYGHRYRSRLVGELAGRQFDAIARWQLLAEGFSAAWIRSWIRTGRLHPRYPGVYAYGRRELSAKGDLACGLLYARGGAALSDLTGLWWRGYLHRRPALIHIDAPGHVSSRDDLRIRHPSEIDRTLCRGLPVADLARCLLLASTSLSHNSLRLVLARADYDKKLSLPSLQSALSRSPRGAHALKAAMDAHLPQLAECANPFERRFVLLCESYRLEIPDPNVRIGRFVPDMLWPTHRLIVELDGEDAHSSPAQLQADRNRQSHLESLGFTVIRFTWWELELEPERVAAKVRAYLIR